MKSQQPFFVSRWDSLRVCGCALTWNDKDQWQAEWQKIDCKLGTFFYGTYRFFAGGVVRHLEILHNLKWN